MFDNSETETYGVDVEKRAQAFREDHPDAPPVAADIDAELAVLNARLDDLEKGRRQKREALREELESDVESLKADLNKVVKAMTGSAPSTSGDADERARERKAIEKEHEVFTR